MEIPNRHFSQKKKSNAFTRDDDDQSKFLARKMGAVWAGNAYEYPGELMDVSIIFAPAGELILIALQSVNKGGVCGGIHLSQMPPFPYDILGEQRMIGSVANLTQNDAIEFIAIVSEIHIKTDARLYQLAEANMALNELRIGAIIGAGALIMNAPLQE